MTTVNKFDQHAARAKVLYDPHGRHLDNYYGRRCTRFNAAGDSENVRKSREEQAKMRTLAIRTGAPEWTLETVLTVQHEYDTLPPDRDLEEHKAARCELTRERLRLKLGDTAKRDQMLRDYQLATSVIAQEVPEFARRMSDTGADLDLRNVEALAPLGARLREAAQPPK